MKTALPGSDLGRHANANASARNGVTFTVFTACYQSAQTLDRVFKSLEAQTFRDFEWLVVDDGSTDDTDSLVRNWQFDCNFPIRYIRQQNRGKHEAVARGLREACGTRFLILDADDECIPSALERLDFHWDRIDLEVRGRFAGVSTLCVDQTGRLVGDEYPHSPLDSDALALRYRYGVRGEKWGFVRTDLLKEYWSDRPAVEGYMPEGVIWDRIARKYSTRFVNERLRVYWIEGPSLTHDQPPDRYPASGRLEHQTVLNEHIDWLSTAPIMFFRSAVHYCRFSFHCGDDLVSQFRRLDNARARSLFVLAAPTAVLVYCLDRLRCAGRRSRMAASS